MKKKVIKSTGIHVCIMSNNLLEVPVKPGITYVWIEGHRKVTMKVICKSGLLSHMYGDRGQRC